MTYQFTRLLHSKRGDTGKGRRNASLLGDLAFTDAQTSPLFERRRRRRRRYPPLRTDTHPDFRTSHPPSYAFKQHRQQQGHTLSNDWTEQRVEARGSRSTCAGHTSEAADRLGRG